jgi:hypothetical protein
MTTNNGGHGGEWLIVGTNNRGNNGGGEGKVTGEIDGIPVEVTVKTRENGNNRGRMNATSTNNTHEDDGIQSYNAKMGYIKV